MDMRGNAVSIWSFINCLAEYQVAFVLIVGMIQQVLGNNRINKSRYLMLKNFFVFVYFLFQAAIAIIAKRAFIEIHRNPFSTKRRVNVSVLFKQFYHMQIAN